MFQLLNEIADPTQELCNKYNIPSWEQYKSGIRIENYPVEPIQYIAQVYAHILAITGHKAKYIVLGKPLLELYVTLGEKIPEKFEDSLITYDLSMPFYAALIM